VAELPDTVQTRTA
jgi:HAD superfamily hydrolase (TIGR01509 family)